jgi:peptide/nickel transport system permease protein
VLARYVLARLLWMLPTLLGITVVTFALMDLAPADRAAIALQGAEQAGTDAVAREQALHRLRMSWGLADPQTGASYSLAHRYGTWLERACRLDFVGAGEDPAAFRARILDALPVTVLVNLLALLVALGIALPLGGWLGMSAGGAAERGVSLALFLVFGLPEFLLATLLLLAFGGGYFAEILPAGGLRSPGAGALPLLSQALDLAKHLALPVAALAIGPCVVASRFLRESVARAAASDFVLAMRALGLPERHVRRRALRNGLSPLITLLGTMLPALVGGSVIVESVFSLPGLGRLAWDAMQARDYAMVMALTLMVSVVTLLGLLLSDVLQRAVDPRVELR